MTANSQLLTTTPKTKTKANYADNQNWNRTTEMEITWRVIRGGVGGERGGKVQRISSINGRQKIDRGRVRIVQEMWKPKNLYVRPMGKNYRGGMWERGDGQDGVE